MDAFDADVLVYAIAPRNLLGRRVRALFREAPAGAIAGVGSVLLVPEVLMKPLREGETDEGVELGALFDRIELLPVDLPTAERATELRARYRLRTVDAIHLATAVVAGAERFITDNRRDFTKSITEVDVTYPVDLPEP